MNENILLKLNYEIELFTKNLSFDLSQNKKYTYLITSDKPFFEFDKLKSFFIENDKTDFAIKELNILLDNCNKLLNLCREFDLMEKINTGFSVHYIDKKKGKGFKGSFGLNKKLVWHTGKTLLKVDEEKFTEIYQSKKIDIYSFNYFTIPLIINKLKLIVLELLDKESLSDRIKNLFSFIDFLHSNIENFKSFDKTIERLYFLDEQRNALKPENNFKEKLKYDEVQNELEQKFKIIDNNIIQKIKEKTIKFDICDWNQTNTIWNYNISDIRKLKENFTTSDVRIILKQKQKYIEFREKTDCNYFQTFFFSDMDKTLKELFNFFNESNLNEFENFETKTIKVNNIKDALQILKNDKKNKFEIILDNHSTENEKQPQRTEIKKTKKTKNLNDYILNIKNKQIFIEDLKKMFPTEKGKPLKAIIRILEKNEILLIPDRQFKSFYESLNLAFKRDIGTYPSINDVKDEQFDTMYLDKFEKKLNPLIIKHKTN
jgi:hypothetical protein